MARPAVVEDQDARPHGRSRASRRSRRVTAQQLGKVQPKAPRLPAQAPSAAKLHRVEPNTVDLTASIAPYV